MFSTRRCHFLLIFEMKETVCLFLIFQILQTAKLSTFDPSTFDYCSIDCNGRNHTACNCEKKKPTNPVKSDNDIANFRKQILEYHNEFRNKIASGEEKDCPKAANMMVLNYDPELEYIAKCHGKSMRDFSHDKCRKKHNHKYNAGQNLYTTTYFNDVKNVVKEAVTDWYNEVQQIPRDVRQRVLKNFVGGNHGHFTEVVWATVTHVGCVMVNVFGSPNTVVCNYAGDDGGGNFKGESVYEFGEPCSKCPNQEKCSDKFPALCGKLEETNILPGKEKKKNDKKKHNYKKKGNVEQKNSEEIRKNQTMLKANDSICVQIDINLLCICILPIIFLKCDI